MRRSALRLAIAIVVASSAGAQTPDAAGAGDVPSGPARIDGRIVRDARPDEVGSIEVVLYALPAGAAPGIRRTVTQADGRFSFDGVANDPDVPYLIGARVGEVPFPGERVRFDEGQRERTVEIRVSEPTTDASAIDAAKVTLRLDWAGGVLLVTETHVLRNASDRVFFVPRADRERRAPALRTGLPAGAADLTGPFGIVPEGLVLRTGEVAFFGPVYPGEQPLSFSYALAVGGAEITLRKGFPSGGAEVTVLAADHGPAVTAAGLQEGEPTSVDGRRYRRYGPSPVAAGGDLALTLAIPPAQHDPSALDVAEVTTFLEHDAAAVSVRQNHRLRVAGDRMLVGAPDQPLYRIALDAEARDVRFATQPPGIALAADESGGALVVTGPLPAGSVEIDLLYHVPVTSQAPRIALQSSRAVPLLSVYVADTGLAIGSDRLHRRRPVRTEDRTYLHLEAFEVEPDEAVTVELESLSRASGPGPTASLAAALAGTAIVGGFLLSPLRRAGAAQEAHDAPDGYAASEREALHAAMRDLEEDFETGKLSPPDYALLRDDLRTRAAMLLRAERDEVETAAPAVRGCVRCGAAPRPTDRFCSQCGATLAAPPAGGPAA